jgi:hypothetical protein
MERAGASAPLEPLLGFGALQRQKGLLDAGGELQGRRCGGFDQVALVCPEDDLPIIEFVDLPPIDFDHADYRVSQIRFTRLHGRIVSSGSNISLTKLCHGIG